LKIICDTDIISSLAKIKELKILDEIFQKPELFISLAVYEELEKAKEIGYDFPNMIFKKFEVISMVEEEVEEYKGLISNKRDLDKGELQSIVISRSRDLIFLTNDKLARKKCKQETIKTYNLAEILRASYLGNLRSKSDIEEIIKSLREKDNFVFSKETDLYQ